MFRSNSFKFFYAFVFVLSFSAACGWRQTKSDAPEQAFVPEEIKSDVPFSTKEPENFSAEFVVAANNQETVTFIARAGNKRRFDYNFGTKNQFTVLQTSASQNFLLLPEKKIYALNNNPTAAAPPQTSGDFRDSLTTEWLNAKAEAKFTNLGAENNLTKYSVRFNDSESAETIIFVDEKINLPVRQEFYTVGGEQKNLTYTLETRNFKTDIDGALFELPKDFRRVSPDSLRAAMRQIKIDEK